MTGTASWTSLATGAGQRYHVWLVHGVEQTRYLALNVGIAESLSREISFLRALGASEAAPGSDAVPHLVDEFAVEGPNRMHPCYETTPALAKLRDTLFSRLYTPVLSMEVCHDNLFLAGSALERRTNDRIRFFLDVHLGNILVRARDSFNGWTVGQFRHHSCEPNVYQVTRTDGEALTPNVPGTAVVAP
ncbi:hypothetical protein ARSEF4850_007952 [Beauveria asiatica]